MVALRHPAPPANSSFRAHQAPSWARRYLITIIRPTTRDQAKNDEFFLYESVRIANFWFYSGYNVEIVVIARERLETLVEALQDGDSPEPTMLYGYPRAPRQDLPWRAVSHLDVVVNHVNDYKLCVIDTISRFTRLAAIEPGVQVVCVLAGHGEFYPHVGPHGDFEVAAMLALDRRAQLFNRHHRTPMASHKSRALGNLELENIVKEAAPSGTNLLLYNLACYSRAWRSARWDLIAYSDPRHKSDTVPRSASDHYRGMRHGVLEQRLLAAAVGLVAPIPRELNADATAWTDQNSHDFGQVFDEHNLVELPARTSLTLSEAQEVWRSATALGDGSNAGGLIEWRVGSTISTSLSPLDILPVFNTLPYSPQFFPLFPTNPASGWPVNGSNDSDEIETKSGCLASDITALGNDVGLHVPRHPGVGLGWPTSFPRSLNKGSSHGAILGKRQRSQEAQTVRPEKVLARASLASSSLATAIHEAWTMASFPSDHSMLECWLTYSLSSDNHGLRRIAADARNALPATLQTRRSRAALVATVRNHDRLLRRSFLLCHVLGLIDASVESLHAFRSLESDVEARDFEESERAGLDPDWFWYDVLDTDCDLCSGSQPSFRCREEHDVVETMHRPMHEYVISLWVQGGKPDLKETGQWARAAESVLRYEATCEREIVQSM